MTRLSRTDTPEALSVFTVLSGKRSGERCPAGHCSPTRESVRSSSLGRRAYFRSRAHQRSYRVISNTVGKGQKNKRELKNPGLSLDANDLK